MEEILVDPTNNALVGQQTSKRGRPKKPIATVATVPTPISWKKAYIAQGSMQLFSKKMMEGFQRFSRVAAATLSSTGQV
uniref:Uncharacterized protein n=1 Tax=Nelumbo nucifera TaxID=4432 RepID=A0A822Z6Q0_NELNU|nr:TPA_asm: hypothetical protein HUJ06_026490 [Nelumbo nucifera]DAD40310.1 TPA_asm: hypothetical protein HUJ06_014633 [Nelumbo nucifera]